MIQLNLDASALQLVADELDATEKQVKLAMRSTVSRMSSWLRVRAGRAIRAETKLRAELLRKRLKNIKLKYAGDGTIGGVWIGLNPIDLKYLMPEQDGLGVTAGPSGAHESYEGAFMGPRPGTLASKLRGGVYARKGKARLPIVRLGMPIQDKANKALEASVFEGFEEQFMKVFEREMKWRTQTQR